MIFLVFCDLENPHRQGNYARFFGELARLEAHQVGAYYWLLRSNSSAEEITTKFWSLADSEDCIFVSALSSSYRYVNAEGGTNAWLRKYLDQSIECSPPPALYVEPRQTVNS